jgi:hypothetical protein
VLVLVRVLADVVAARVLFFAGVGMTVPHRSMRRRNDPRCDGPVAHHRTPRLGNAHIDRTAAARRGTILNHQHRIARRPCTRPIHLYDARATITPAITTAPAWLLGAALPVGAASEGSEGSNGFCRVVFGRLGSGSGWRVSTPGH